MNTLFFESCVKKLDIYDLTILGLLYDREADAAFKAISNKEIIDNVKFSRNKYFNSLKSLFATCLIESSDSRNSKVYITEYGIMAVQKTLEGVNEQC